VRALQAALGDSMRLLHGVELNIGPNGELDYDLEFRRGFDWCLASVHDHFELDRAAQTRRIVTAMQDPAVRMIGHLSARVIGGRPPIDLDLDAVFDAAEATGTALEVNGSLPRLDLSVEVLRRARDRKVTFVLTSDAHEAGELERVRFAALNAERAWIDPERIANAWAPERLLAWAPDKSRGTAGAQRGGSGAEQRLGSKAGDRRGGSGAGAHNPLFPLRPLRPLRPISLSLECPDR